MYVLHSTLRVICLTLISIPGMTQAPVQIPDDRSFRKIHDDYQKIYANTPVKGNHKRAKRALHYWERRLDSNGNVFNHVLANIEALEQLYIDTFPANIQGDWQHIGPLNSFGSDYSQEGLGRVNQIFFASAATWYAGTAGGGLWRTDLAGIYAGFGDYPWYPLTDNLPVLSISGIAVNPNDVDDIYILTGDGESASTFPTRGTQPGIGILHSPDGGMTWDPTALQYNLTQLQAGYKLIQYPGNFQTMFAACTDALYRTTDGWIDPINMSTPISTTCYDIEFKPDDPQTVYAACQGSLRRSVNGGITFTDISANLVQTNLNMNTIGRMAIAVTPDDPEYLYIVIAQSNGGLMSFQYSTDGGDTFIETITNSYNILAANEITDNDGQGNYDLAIWADPNNAQTVIVGGVNIWKSITSGLLWGQIVHWTNEPPEYTHADIHALETNPFTGDIVAGTDGGLYVSSDGGIEWENRGRGLGITQYYHLDVWTAFLGLPIIAGGAQDNGTSTGTGFADPVFQMIGGGDGFRTYRGSSDGNAMRYRTSQNGKIYWQTHIVDDFWDEELVTPEDELNANDEGLGAWDTPYQPNPNNFAELLAGYDELYYSSSYGESWIDLTYPDGFSYNSGALITQLAWSKVNGNVIFFFIADNTRRHLYKCEAFYVAAITGSLENSIYTIHNLDTISVMPGDTNSSGRPTDIALSDMNTDEVWISFPGYIAPNKVYYNPDMAGSGSWVNITYNLPNVPVHCIEWDVDGLYAGTDIGAFYLPHGEVQWIYFSQGLPTVAVTEIEVRNTILGKMVFASTWGRGIWRSTPPVPVRRTRWYVDDSAVGFNSGASWANALTNLQVALDTALAGDSIWVAAGTYYPETNSGFHLSQPNVFIWGGFNGTEDSVAQRDYVMNESKLSGDIGIPGDSLDNANHVFVFGGHNGNVLLDGFHITDGNAKGTGENSNGGGIYYSTGLQTGKPVIRNCRIYNNTAFGGSGYPNHVGYGAGMYIADYASGDPEMIISNCIFENNFARNRGGGLCIDVAKTTIPADTGTAVIHLESCVFLNNTATSEGGAIYLEAIRNGIIRLYVDSTEFDGNHITSFQGNGGAVSGDVSPGNGTIELECSNSSFTNHTLDPSYAYGGAVYFNVSGGLVNASYSACIFEGNVAGDGGAVYTHCSGSLSSSTQVFKDCTVLNNTGAAGGALYFNSTFRGLTEVNLTGCMINNNSANGRGGAIYFNGDNGGLFDVTIDSCEFMNNTAGENGAIRFFVRKGSSSSMGRGALAMTHCHFEENSATGSSSGGAMVLYSSSGIIDANIAHTDFVSNTTGTRGGAVAHEHTPLDTSRVSVEYSNCTFTDNAVTIAGGNGGGALSFDKTDAIVQQCVFTENTGKYGGAVYNLAGGFNDLYTQVFNDCQFYRNKGTDRGGAFYFLHNDPSTLVSEIVSCLLDSNYNTVVAGDGGAIYTHGEGRSMQTISTTTFIDNYAVSDGGAIYLQRSTGAPIFDTLFMYVDHCTFFNNDAGTSGETIDQFGNSSAIISHWSYCDFYNDEPTVMFLNRRSQTHTTRATFAECNFFMLAETPEPVAPIQISTED